MPLNIIDTQVEVKKSPDFHLESQVVSFSIVNTSTSNILFNDFNLMEPGATFTAPVVPGEFYAMKIKLKIVKDVVYSESATVLIKQLIKT